MASLPTKVALASALFGVVHSIAASDRAKAKWPFPRETYRLFYNAQALVTFGALTAYIAAQPKKTIYHVRGPASLLLRIGQWSGVAFAVAAARATGIAKLAGLEPPPPAAQGPESGDNGVLRADGPFRLVRHPLNLAPLAPFWLTPHLTTRRLAFNAVATAYLVIGSFHEEKRLLRQYGEQYEQYRRSGVPFYVPGVKRLP